MKLVVVGSHRNLRVKASEYAVGMVAASEVLSVEAPRVVAGSLIVK